MGIGFLVPKVKKNKVFKFHGHDVIITAISDDGSLATLHYAAGSGKTGYAGTVRLKKNNPAPTEFEVQVVDEIFDDNEVVTLEQYYVPDSLEGNEGEDVVVSYIRNNKPLSEEQKESFLNSPSSNIRRMMGMRTDLKPEQYDALMNDKDAWVRGLLPYNKNISHDQLRTLANDKSADIREGVAWREDAPADILLGLINDKSVEVRLRLASNKKITEGIQVALTKDRSSRVRMALLSNASLTSQVRKILTKDSIAKVALEAQKG